VRIIQTYLSNTQRVLTGGFVRLESAGKVMTASGYYRLGDRVHVMNGAIIGFAQNPVGEHVV